MHNATAEQSNSLPTHVTGELSRELLTAVEALDDITRLINEVASGDAEALELIDLIYADHRGQLVQCLDSMARALLDSTRADGPGWSWSQLHAVRRRLESAA
jgi:hypothetical protein